MVNGQPIYGKDLLSKSGPDLVDMVITPYLSFAMLNFRGVHDGHDFDPSFLHGDHAIPFDVISYDYPSYIQELAARYPDYPVGPFTASIGLGLEGGPFAEMVCEDRMWALAAAFAEYNEAISDSSPNPGDLMLTPESALSYVKSQVLFDTWRQVVKQQGKNFFHYPGTRVAAIRFGGGELYVAEKDGDNYCGSDPYEFYVYSARSAARSHGEIYPVSTFELTSRISLKGFGAAEFAEKFWGEDRPF